MFFFSPWGSLAPVDIFISSLVGSTGSISAGHELLEVGEPGPRRGAARGAWRCMTKDAEAMVNDG